MYFDRDNFALPHFSTFFLERSEKEREQAEKLLEYQNLRGGRILLQTIPVSAACSGNGQTPHILSVISECSIVCCRNRVGRIGKVDWTQCPFLWTTRSLWTRASWMCIAEPAATLTPMWVRRCAVDKQVTVASADNRSRKKNDKEFATHTCGIWDVLSVRHVTCYDGISMTDNLNYWHFSISVHCSSCATSWSSTSSLTATRLSRSWATMLVAWPVSLRPKPMVPWESTSSTSTLCEGLSCPMEQGPCQKMYRFVLRGSMASYTVCSSPLSKCYNKFLSLVPPVQGKTRAHTSASIYQNYCSLYSYHSIWC